MALGTGLFVNSDIYSLDNITRHVGISHGRNLLIDTLRELFSRDKNFHYVTDIFGFPKTKDQLGLDANAGINDDITTRISIGSIFRYEGAFLPSITVKQVSTQYKPISFNQNKYTIQYETQRTEDGYGNVDFNRVPSKWTAAGAWDQSFEIKITSNSYTDTSEIADVILVSLQHTYRDILEFNGLLIKHMYAGAESGESVGNNDPLFTQSITVSTYSEFRKEVPITSLVDKVSFCFNMDLGNTLDPPATGLAIKFDLTS